MAFHSRLPENDIHAIVGFTVADSTARLALTLDSDDINKIARQTDDDSYWILLDLIPTWIQIATGSGNSHSLEDAVVNSVSDVVDISHNSTGTPVVGFGTGLNFQAEDATTPDTRIGGLEWDWSTLTPNRSGVSLNGELNGAKVELARLETINTTTLAPDVRGAGSIDFQQVRGLASQVAGGNYSTILNGAHNTIHADNSYGVIIGGYNNTLPTSPLSTSAYATIISGSSNSITNAFNTTILNSLYSNITGTIAGVGSCSILSGRSNTIASLLPTFNIAYSTIVNGYTSTTESPYSFMGTGKLNTVGEAAHYSTILNGFTNAIADDAKHSTIINGKNITISSPYGFIGGGNNNLITGALSKYSFIGNGLNNTVGPNLYSSVLNGRDNTVAATSSSILGGNYHNISAGSLHLILSGGSNLISSIGSSSSIISGISNTISAGSQNIILNGTNNTAISQYGTILNGENVLVNKVGQISHNSGIHSVQGDSQKSELVVRTHETHGSTTWRELFLDGASARISIATDSVWTFEAIIVGGDAGMTNKFSYKIEGCIENNGGTVALLANTKTIIYESDVNFDSRVIGDNTNKSLNFEVSDSGSSGLVVRWNCAVRLIELIYA